jgi:RecB family exonuclease
LSLQRAAAKMEFIDDEHAPPADPATLPHRSTDVLKYQSHCPFRAFAQFRLGAQELESPELGLDRRIRGGLVETALEIFWGHMRDSVNLRDLTPSARLNEVLDNSVEKALDDGWPESQNVWDQRLRAIEKRRLRNLLRQWCDVELRRRDEFDVMLDEQQQEIDIELGGLKIHGRIDRVDRLRRGGFVVIDYKSGMKPKPANWVSERPEEPQLPLYAVYQLEQGREVKGVAFGHVTTADAAWLGYGDPPTVVGITRDTFKHHLNGKTWPQFVTGWKVTLENLATQFVAGNAEVDPKRPFGNKSTCRYCHLHSLCRVAEKSFATGEEDGGGDDE